MEKRDHFLCKLLTELIQTEVITPWAELVIFWPLIRNSCLSGWNCLLWTDNLQSSQTVYEKCMSCILFSYDYIIHCIPYPWGNWTLSSQLPSSLSHLLHTILSTLPSNQPLSASPCHCINAALHLPVDFHNSNQNRSPYLSLSFCQSTLYTITRVIFEKHHLVLSIPALTLSSSPCSL